MSHLRKILFSFEGRYACCRLLSLSWGLGGEWNKNSELQIEVKQVWEGTLGKNRVLFSEKIGRKDVQ